MTLSKKPKSFLSGPRISPKAITGRRPPPS
jgi:hypothetical protein